jgi:radical SAM protein with 4Fe4S-binding SPASM domain
MLRAPIIDSTTKRKNAIAAARLSDRDGIPIFSIVEISVVAACNRRCPFCPVSDDYYKKLGLSGVMKLPLYEKLLSDLSSIDYSGMILFSGESEPLLHKRLDRLINSTKLFLPNCQIEVNSNGDLLTVRKLAKLFESGLDTISISMYDGPHQIDEFSTLRDQVGLTDSQVLLRRRYFEDGNFGINMTNRGGLVDSDAFQLPSNNVPHSKQEFPINQECYYPFYMLTVDVGGNVTICSHDWAKKYVVGNFGDDHIFDIWIGQRFDRARRNLSKCDRTLPSCQKCNAIGDLIGKSSFDKWLMHYENNPS